MAQTTYNLVPAIGVPGQMTSTQGKVVSYPAGEAIQAGRACIVASGLLYNASSASGIDAALVKFAGVSLYDDAKPGQLPGVTAIAEYAIGDMVPVLRRGSCFAQWNGTTQTELAIPNVNTSSTVGTNRGVFTDAAVSATPGAEISSFQGGVALVANTALTTMCEVDLNLPA